MQFFYVKIPEREVVPQAAQFLVARRDERTELLDLFEQRLFRQTGRLRRRVGPHMK